MREEETPIKRRTYARRITDNISDTETDRQKERNADQDTYLFTCNQWQYSRTLIEVFREKEREKETRTNRRKYTPTMSDKFSRTLLHIFRDKENKKKKKKRKKRRKKEKNDQETYMHIQWVITYPDSGMEIQSQRDETEVRITRLHIHAGIIIIIHHFSRTLLRSERDERACSHTCKLPIIHQDTETDISTER